MILIFFGPPGAGKGTQAKYIAEKFNIIHLSTGDILRNQLLKNDALSFILKKIMDSGNLVSDDILNEIVTERIDAEDCKNGFILDGYPRTIEQAIFLNKQLEKKKLIVNNIIDFVIDKETIKKRLKLRSLKENRKDDNDQVIATRIEKYFNETKPLSDLYKTKYSSAYEPINGDQEIDKLNAELIKIIKKT